LRIDQRAVERVNTHESKHATDSHPRIYGAAIQRGPETGTSMWTKEKMPASDS